MGGYFDPRAREAAMAVSRTASGGVMQNITERPPICVVVAFILGASLAACSGTVNEFTVFADPGKYEFYSCEMLAGPRRYWTDREQELKLLIDKAKEGTGGTLVSVVAYQSDYVTAREELKVIEATARIKKCKIPDDPQRKLDCELTVPPSCAFMETNPRLRQ
jgi:hypothetical protein